VRPRQRRRVEDDARPAARGRGAGDVGVGGVERGAGGQHGAQGGRGRGQRRRGHSDASPDRMEAGRFLRRLGGSRQFNSTSADRGDCARSRTAAAAEGGRRSREGRTRSEQHRVENAKKKTRAALVLDDDEEERTSSWLFPLSLLSKSRSDLKREYTKR